jgi:serine phosphatase RsbU (regulator of sigma subunit)
MINEQMLAFFTENKQKYEKEAIQYVFFEEKGKIINSNNTFIDLSNAYGQSVYDFFPFLDSLNGVFEGVETEESFYFPRVEMPVGERNGVFDYTITKKIINNIAVIFVAILDNTQNNKYLFDVQQERNDAVIAKEIAQLKLINETLKEEVRQRTQEITRQKEELEDTNRKIIESIECASRIQKNLLPNDLKLQNLDFKIFTFNRPRDIVGGDFYWVHNRNEICYIALADCTGHGVAAAMTSMIGHLYLNEIMEENKYINPAQIVFQLDEKVKALFASNMEVKVQDGMEIAVVAIDTKKKTFTYAGAKRELYYISGEDFFEIKASPHSINGYLDIVKEFANHTLPYQAGDMIYLSSDGYPDQFGGEKDKRISKAGFRKVASDASKLPFYEQENFIANKFDAWKEGYDQIDDVLVLGIRFE